MRLTREQMAEKYPDQWLGISNIQCKDNDGITIESADVIYTNKTRDELLELQINSDNIIGWYATEDNLHLGLMGFLKVMFER